MKDVIKLAKEIGAISAYAYLGDVGDSVTGDKKTQKFEDDYIDQLFEVIKELGFNACNVYAVKKYFGTAEKDKEFV